MQCAVHAAVDRLLFWPGPWTETAPHVIVRVANLNLSSPRKTRPYPKMPYSIAYKTTCISKHKTDIRTRQNIHTRNTIPIFKSIFFPSDYTVVHLFLIKYIMHNIGQQQRKCHQYSLLVCTLSQKGFVVNTQLRLNALPLRLKKARFCMAFLWLSKKCECVKKSIISKSGFKKAKLAALPHVIMNKVVTGRWCPRTIQWARPVVLNLFYPVLSNKITRFTPNTLSGAHFLKYEINKLLQFRTYKNKLTFAWIYVSVNLPLGRWNLPPGVNLP